MKGTFKKYSMKGTSKKYSMEGLDNILQLACKQAQSLF